ncbi:PEP-CTERM sorting domain-containing protein [Aliagarivorans taiwanensis]|uniref:PEP-CTERM sorting domain-containing protein n=1 Tax=Aliagarivorans taiwanensis TaxID=561966 RepID=UPI00040C7404|nr:PEP-CTERM sorting domain-containing protein [Aliagarivorans taiwanensis]
MIQSLSAAALLFTAQQASAVVLTFTDQAAWEASVAGYTIIDETFSGPENLWDPLSGSSNVQAGVIDVELSGGHQLDDEPTPVGVLGNGLFSGEVDASFPIFGNEDDEDPEEHDGVNLSFGYSNFGFGIYNLADTFLDADDDQAPSLLDVSEIGIAVNGEEFILSDLLGLSPDSEGNIDVLNVPFIGFSFGGMEVSSFSFIHGDQIRDVQGAYEEFTIDGILFATDSRSASAPEPTTLLLFALGLLGLRRRLG